MLSDDAEKGIRIYIFILLTCETGIERPRKSKHKELMLMVSKGFVINIHKCIFIYIWKH